MTGLSLGAFFFSLVPFAILAYGTSEAAMWSASSVLYSAYIAVLHTSALVRNHRLGIGPRLRAGRIMSQVTPPVSIALLLLGAFGPSPLRGAGPYVTVITLQLAHATLPLVTFLVFIDRER